MNPHGPSPLSEADNGIFYGLPAVATLTPDYPKLRRATVSAAHARIISPALELFARNGVGGTSLLMIAENIGVQKAAVYHQDNTKDEIVLAVAEVERARLKAVVEAAEAEPTPTRARDALVAGIVDLPLLTDTRWALF